MEHHHPAIILLFYFLICVLLCKHKNSTLRPLITLYFYIILCPWRFNYWMNMVDLYDRFSRRLLENQEEIHTKKMHSSLPLNAIMR